MIQSKEELKEYIEYESHGFSNKFPDSIIGEPSKISEVIKKNGILSQLSERIYLEKLFI